MNSCASEDSNLRSIFRRVMQFYKPISNQFCQCEFNNSRTRLYSTVGCYLMDSLTVIEEVSSFSPIWIDGFTFSVDFYFYSWSVKRFWPNFWMMSAVQSVIFLWLLRLMTAYLVLGDSLQQLAGITSFLSVDWAAPLMELLLWKRLAFFKSTTSKFMFLSLNSVTDLFFIKQKPLRTGS